MESKLVLLSESEQQLRIGRVTSLMAKRGVDALLISTSTNIYYLTGRVIAGYVYVSSEGRVAYFVKRPAGLEDPAVAYIRKPEQIADLVAAHPATLGLELSAVSYSAVERLRAVFPGAALADASALMMQARTVKTPYEIELMTLSGAKHDRVYSLIPKLYREGMTDIELQIEVERVMRMEGCLGQTRLSGDSMEIHMGNLLAGDNADVPSPYDFTMGGAGMDPSLPVGADGSLIRRGQTVMADMNGNFDGYMTDMSRVYALGSLPELALRAHDCSIAICRAIAEAGVPGTVLSDLYAIAAALVAEHKLEPYFMGHRQQAPFIGHGVSIELNEMPVITARSKAVLEAGNTLAVEPKFVIPGVGALGIENTYVVTEEGMRSLTHAPEEIIYFQ